MRNGRIHEYLSAEYHVPVHLMLPEIDVCGLISRPSTSV